MDCLSPSLYYPSCGYDSMGGWLQHQPMLAVAQQQPQIQSLPPPHQIPFVSPQHLPMQIPMLPRTLCKRPALLPDLPLDRRQSADTTKQEEITGKLRPSQSLRSESMLVKPTDLSVSPSCQG
nr:PREDICTED: amelogenin, X isoform [Struthio camelus australis]